MSPNTTVLAAREADHVKCESDISTTGLRIIPRARKYLAFIIRYVVELLEYSIAAEFRSEVWSVAEISSQRRSEIRTAICSGLHTCPTEPLSLARIGASFDGVIGWTAGDVSYAS